MPPRFLVSANSAHRAAISSSVYSAKANRRAMVVQEAINNIIKHSRATKATIQLMKYPDLVILTIEDNGVGFDSQLVKSKFGLNSIKSRSSLMNGNCSFDSKPGEGTTLIVEVPLY